MNTFLAASHGSNVEGMKDKLVKDLKSVVADADGLLNEVANYTSEEVAAARTKIEGRLGEARTRLNVARSVVTEKARGAADAAQVYVTDNPWKVLGVAAAAGVVIYSIFSRR